MLGAKALQNFLERTDKMNPIAGNIKMYVQALSDIVPSKISEIKNIYDPTVKATGPYLEPNTGITYMGQVKNGIAEGWGKVVTKQGDYYEGFFISGVLDVYCRQLSRTGKYYEGGLKHGHRHGKGFLVDSARIRIECTWEQGTPMGLTKIFDRNNLLLFEGESCNGLLSGDNCYYRDKVRGFEYRGGFSKGKFNGKGTKWYDNKDVYEGPFENGHENGQGKLSFADGTVYSGTFKDGRPHGNGSVIKVNGKDESVTFENGQMIRTE